VLIPIPIGTKFTAIVAGSVPKLVRCEQCGVEYVYTLERAAAVEGTSLFGMDEAAAKSRAGQDAERALAFQLHFAFDPVPCPSCGFYQSAMVQRLRAQHLEWMYQLAVGCGLVALLFLFLALIVTVAASSTRFVTIAAGVLWSLTGLLLLAVETLILVRRRRVQRYTPNDEDVEVRKQLGRRLALPRSEYEKMVRELYKQGKA
jgi:hypothetical protein